MNATQRNASTRRAAEVTPQTAGHLFRKWISDRKLTQEDLARMSGETRSTVSRLVYGQSKVLHRALRLLAALDMEIVPRERVADSAAEEVA